ncbi:hypothetical protein AB1K91_16335 [Terribacillus sp. 179-K 1B1 HS]|uniref:hypothetical protein n=1 Tax=Terribacillus sp. 179-K 1B1 HS TaxID=3142388 RepID=UPI00399FB32A
MLYYMPAITPLYMRLSRIEPFQFIQQKYSIHPDKYIIEINLFRSRIPGNE